MTEEIPYKQAFETENFDALNEAFRRISGVLREAQYVNGVKSLVRKEGLNSLILKLESMGGIEYALGETVTILDRGALYMKKYGPSQWLDNNKKINGSYVQYSYCLLEQNMPIITFQICFHSEKPEDLANLL